VTPPFYRYLRPNEPQSTLLPVANLDGDKWGPPPILLRKPNSSTPLLLRALDPSVARGGGGGQRLRPKVVHRPVCGNRHVRRGRCVGCTRIAVTGGAVGVPDAIPW
jgi:hypothetical protein